MSLWRTSRRANSSSTSSRLNLGAAGEAAAAGHLEELGFILLEVGYRVPVGEIDLVAREGEALVFVEVKTRSRSSPIRPEASMTSAKKRRIERIARWYLASHSIPPDSTVRFDVVAVEEQNGLFSFRHYRGAFMGDGLGA